MADKIDKTIRLGPEDKSTNFTDGTVRLPEKTDNVKSGVTLRVSEETVIASGLSKALDRPGIENNTYDLNGKTYKLIKKISDSTTEAQIYLTTRDGEKYILKYYYPFVKPKKKIIEKLRSFAHPDIVSVVDYGYHEERFFEILHFADGGSLADHLPIKDVKLLKRILRETTNALNYCHKNGIIHRDVKPANIFIMKNKDILLGDFGIASVVNDEKQLRRTSIFQTPIYAAPEYKMTLRGETVISKAVDYYALGITVWELWSGKLPPDGIDDLEFLRLMFEGAPPLPAGMNEEIAWLIKGLTTRDYKKRWGAEEVKKWLNGEAVEIYEDKTTSEASVFEFGEDEEGNKLTATTSGRLAKLIAENPDLGRKHLYRGTIKEWLKKKGDQALYLEIADITEYKYKDSETVGTNYSIYVLDREYPFKGLKGSLCHTKEDLIKELRNSFSEYKTLLKNPEHKFYLYLLSKNMEDEVEAFRSFYSRFDEVTALHYVIYSLEFSINRNTPFNFVLDGKFIPAASIKELAGILRQYPDLGKNLEAEKDFRVWLYVKDSSLFHEFNEFVSKHKNSSRLARLLPYFFEGQLSYTGLNGTECTSLEGIGEELAENYEQYKNILKDKSSEIYCYFEVMEYEGEIEFFNKAFDKELTSSKPGIYNDDIALCKIIKGCGYNMPFQTSAGSVDTPEELFDIYSKVREEIKPHLEEKDSFLNAWLSVFYHEAPLNDDGTMYIYYREDYENRLKDFVNYLGKLEPTLEVVERYRKGIKITGKITKHNDISFSHRKRETILAFIFPLMSAVGLFTYLLYNESDLPLNIFEIDSWYYYVWAIGTAVWLLWNGYETGDLEITTSCIGGPIIGLILGAVAYYIFWFIISVPLFLGIVLGLALYFLYTKQSNLAYEYLYDFLPEEIDANSNNIEENLFKYVFGKTSKPGIEKPESLKAVEKDRRTFRWKAWSLGLAFSIIMIIILFVVITFNTNIQG